MGMVLHEQASKEKIQDRRKIEVTNYKQSREF